jgi:hypothetical protein
MKNRVCCRIAAIVLSACSVFAQQLTVQDETGKQTVLQMSDIEALPHAKVVTTASGPSASYDGVTLKSILEKSGVALGESLRGKRMSLCLLITAADGYRIVLALPEIDPAFTDKQVVLAFAKDGKPLDAKEGPYRLVIPDEKRMARWIRQVTALKVVDVQ